MKSLRSILTVACLLLSMSVYAQSSISGKIFDHATGEPIIGASIYIPGTSVGTKSDNLGQFKLQVPSGKDSFYVSFIGYVPKKIAVSGTPFSIALKASQSTLNRVVISASRNSQPRVNTPVAISTISPQDMKETHATQLDQLLNKAAGVYMVDLGNEQHTMAMRLPIGFNVLYLYMVDGIPIRPTGITNHNALLEINSEAMERIEVIKGPASSIYGSRAVGGVVNFITKKPSVLPQTNVELLWGSRGYKRTNISASTTTGKLGLAVAGYYANRNVAERFHEDFHKSAVNFRADYAFNSQTHLTTTLAYVDYKTDMNGSLDSAHFYDREYVENPVSLQRFTYRSDQLVRSRVSLNHDWSDDGHTDFTLYYREDNMGQNPSYRIRKTDDPNLSFGQINSNRFHSYGAIFQHHQHFVPLNIDWITGLSFDYSPMRYDAELIWIKNNEEGVHYDYYSNTPDSVIKNYSAALYNYAVYTQLALNPTRKLRVVLGLRYDGLSYNFTNHLPPGPLTGPENTTNTFDHLTPKVGATYNLGKGNGLYVNYSVGFNPPGVSIYSEYVVPELKPSTFYNYEVGGWINLGDKGFAELALYHMVGNDEVVSLRKDDGTSVSQNSGKTLHQGVELSVHYAPVQELSFQFGGTYMRHEYVNFIIDKTDVSGNEMKSAPPYVINSKITYKPRFFEGFKCSLDWQSIDGYYTDAKNTKFYDGYNIFNAELRYSFSQFEVWLNCLNLTNEVYATVVNYKYGKNQFDAGQLRRFQIGIGFHLSK